MKSNVSEDKSDSYRPLIVLIGIIFLSSAALGLSKPFFLITNLMNNFMGLFFVLFSMFKFMNLNGFADGFQMYDIVAKRTRIYAYIYPCLELTLGLLYLSNYYLRVAYAATLLLMIISVVGVIKSINAGMNLRCACLGTVLNVPLSTVSIIENIGMGLMALVMLIL